MSQTTITREFAVSAERLYEALADQDSAGSWLGVKVSVPVRGEGSLVGTVRRMHLRLFAFDERIDAAEPPRAIDYHIVPPMPLLRRHQGEMRIESLGPDRSRLRWHIVLELKLGADVLLLPLIKGALLAGLARLSKRLASGAGERAALGANGPSASISSP